MATVTIGVPVYNGAATLAKSLECLRTQTYRDIEVIVADNASTDDSADIAQGFVDRDPRFRLIRRDSNIGPVPNFFSLLGEASSELFMWRADDDWSDADYIEKLKELFDRDAKVRLAASECLLVRHNGEVLETRSFSRPEKGSRIRRIGHVLMHLSSNSIYGLWHRKTLVEILARTQKNYPYIWAWDHLAMFPVILAEGVAGTNETRLYAGRDVARRYSASEPAAKMWEMRRSFRAACFAEMRMLDLTFSERILLSVYVMRYANIRVYRFWKTVRRQIRETLGVGGKA
ncbi:glycosyl transferase family 2 [Parvibaculum lavamentivorans DS-1]|uniref:Glycosyl transferase family 2 n=1 Tax=Parvibaculum lavamentivorans (strain DS-1 / DSM 13023 / NCIMB 13966) TaxID=402881 RepID=A7HYH0_PARL1|nr:glycosyltransferase [Parvibaculum lavamentivorans]ABS64953.1 glycosyl transferase family 2 [Parvibaculum lavamentivorans DS-1]